MPHKHIADRHIPRMSFKVRYWPGYKAGLRLRGSLTLWVDEVLMRVWTAL